MHIRILANKIKNFLYTLPYVNKNICNNLNDIKLKCYDDKYVKHIINKSIFVLKENITLKYFILLQNRLIGSYIHHNKLVGSVISIDSSIQYKEKSIEKLKILAKDLAMHIVALSPKFICKNKIDSTYIYDQKQIILKQKHVVLENKSEKIVSKIIHGNLNKNLSDVCLLDQKFIKDQSITIKKEITKHEKSMKIAISLTYFFIFRIKG
jgi:elongation factor Ts